MVTLTGATRNYPQVEVSGLEVEYWQENGTIGTTVLLVPAARMEDVKRLLIANEGREILASAPGQPGIPARWYQGHYYSGSERSTDPAPTVSTLHSASISCKSTVVVAQL